MTSLLNFNGTPNLLELAEAGGKAGASGGLSVCGDEIQGLTKDLVEVSLCGDEGANITRPIDLSLCSGEGVQFTYRRAPGEAPDDPIRLRR